MDNKPPNYKPKQSSASTPKAPVARSRKPAYLRAFLPKWGGQCCPPNCPPQPGPFLREPEAFPGLPDRRNQVPLGPLGGALGRPLDITQVAELLGCSPWTVRQTLIPRGLPHFRFKASGRLTFFEGQVIRWIESQQQGGTK